MSEGQDGRLQLASLASSADSSNKTQLNIFSVKATSPPEPVKLLLLSAEVPAPDEGADREATFLHGLFKTLPPRVHE